MQARQQRVLLTTIQRFTPLTVGDLARLVEEDRNATSAAVERLVARGLVRRRPSQHTPQTLLSLTLAGHVQLTAGDDNGLLD